MGLHNEGFTSLDIDGNEAQQKHYEEQVRLRDYFAAAALTGFIAATGHELFGIALAEAAQQAGTTTEFLTAQAAYQLADEMLERRAM